PTRLVNCPEPPILSTGRSPAISSPPPRSRLFRIHFHQHRPWWFSQKASSRFDLRPPGDLGTCYFAEQPEGCFLEVFKNFSTAVSMTDIQLRRLTRIELA